MREKKKKTDERLGARASVESEEVTKIAAKLPLTGTILPEFSQSPSSQIRPSSKFMARTLVSSPLFLGSPIPSLSRQGLHLPNGRFVTTKVKFSLNDLPPTHSLGNLQLLLVGLRLCCTRSLMQLLTACSEEWRLVWFHLWCYGSCIEEMVDR
jgi:hypothetical protein